MIKSVNHYPVSKLFDIEAGLVYAIPRYDQFFNLLVAGYGNTWVNNTLLQLLKQADHTGKTLESKKCAGTCATNPTSTGTKTGDKDVESVPLYHR